MDVVPIDAHRKRRRERDGDVQAPKPTSGERLSDVGNARRFVTQWGRDLLYLPASRVWLFWNGSHWERDELGAVRRMAKLTAVSIYQEAAAADVEGVRKALADHARRTESERRLHAMLELAWSEPGIAIREDELDANPWLLGVANGTIDLRTARLRPGDRADRITRVCAVDWNPRAEAPLWRAVLERCLPDPEVRAFFHRFIGYAITGDTREQVLLVAWGNGANGKSTIIETIRDMLGGHAMQAPADTVLAKRETGIQSDIADLPGKRFVTITETEDGHKLAEARVKLLTGGDVVQARQLYGRWFGFRPVAKFILATNHRPQIRGCDHAMWRRIRLVPFTVRIPEAERDLALREKLRGELPGILRWAVEGCTEWQRIGLAAPAAVKDATDEYRAHEDVLGAWIEERCTVLDGVRGEMGALYADYSTWSESAGEHAMTQRALGDRLAERGHDTHRGTGGRRYRLRIALRSDASAPDRSVGDE
jgi:putative DNA primase/helicase